MGAAQILQKLQVTFAKRPALRFLSHHDLMRTFHRALRRAGLPVRMTGGFNPRPRVVFAHALEVGIPSEDEAAEIELVEWVAPVEFARRLAAELPEGLEILRARLVPPRRRSSTAVEAEFRAELAEEDLSAVRAGVDGFMRSESWPVERRDREGGVRGIDLRPHVIELSLEGRVLRMRLRLGRPGAARPREVVAAILGRPGDPMLEVPLRKTKTVLVGPA